MKLKKVLVTDLDDTLLHSEPEAIPVWGRSGYRYLSGKTAALLAEISRKLPVVIATGRNARSIRPLVNRLEQTRFCGFVLENGLISTRDLNHHHGPETDEWAEVVRLLPDWERLIGYENCLGLIFPSDEKRPKDVLKTVLSDTGKEKYHLYQERHKLFVYPFIPSKLSGVRSLGFEPLIALGDEINDLDMLHAAAYPGTMTTAREEVKQCVRERNGYCSAFGSHKAAEDLLVWAKQVCSSAS